MKAFYHFITSIFFYRQGFPKKKTRLPFTQVHAAFKATESDDELRNIDVLMRVRKMNQRAVLEWIFNHNCCPDEFKEKMRTPEGWRVKRAEKSGRDRATETPPRR